MPSDPSLTRHVTRLMRTLLHHHHPLPLPPHTTLPKPQHSHTQLTIHRHIHSIPTALVALRLHLLACYANATSAPSLYLAHNSLIDSIPFGTQRAIIDRPFASPSVQQLCADMPPPSLHIKSDAPSASNSPHMSCALFHAITPPLHLSAPTRRNGAVHSFRAPWIDGSGSLRPSNRCSVPSLVLESARWESAETTRHRPTLVSVEPAITSTPRVRSIGRPRMCT